MPAAIAWGRGAVGCLPLPSYHEKENRGQERHATATQTGWGLWALWRVSRSPEPACTSSHHTAPCLLRAPLSNLLMVLSVPGQDTNSWSSRMGIQERTRQQKMGAGLSSQNYLLEPAQYPSQDPLLVPHTQALNPIPSQSPATFTQGTLSKKSVIGQGYGMQQEAAAENVAPRPAAPLEQYP